MTDKQIIIDDQKETIHRLQQECTEKTNAIIALGEQLQTKEQECEEKQKTAQDAISKLCTEKSALYNELDKLKRDNDLFRTCHDNEQEKRRKYEQTLTEIKEIAEENIRIADLEGLNGVYRRGLAKQILQKISEVENEN